MRWIKVDKNGAAPSTGSTYRDWKSHLASEARHKCVYCAIHEKALGGFWNFHVEHFRPKSKFPTLVNDYCNLFYACAICNTFKGNDWPRDPDPELATACYPDPSVVDYNRIFTVGARGLIVGLTVASKYVVEKIYLNRPQLILERHDSNLQDQFDQLNERLNASIEQLLQKSDAETMELLKELFRCTREIAGLQSSARKIRPYAPHETKRN